MTNWVDAEDWRTIVASVPIPSVDLVVCHDDGIVLGRRTNDPARGEWFVPGGRVQKGEQLTEAVHRVARAELGVDVTVRERLGAYDHLYDTSDVEDVASKHYVAHGFVVEPDDDPLAADDQHANLRVFRPPFPDLHPYVEQYLSDALASST